MNVKEIIKSSDYDLSQFDSEKIANLEERIKVKEQKGKSFPYVSCIVRKLL